MRWIRYGSKMVFRVKVKFLFLKIFLMDAWHWLVLVAKKVNTLAMPLISYGYKMESKAKVKSGFATIKALEILPLSVLVLRKANT